MPTPFEDMHSKVKNMQINIISSNFLLNQKNLNVEKIKIVFIF